MSKWAIGLFYRPLTNILPTVWKYYPLLSPEQFPIHRTASKLGKSEAKCKLAAAVLLTAPGEPYIYYGEELGIYGTKEKADEYVRCPMLWGDNYTTAYTDKIDATVASSIKSVAEQKENANSLLNTYLSFTRLRNTYPALAQGTMTKHAVYNESNEKYKSIARCQRTRLPPPGIYGRRPAFPQTWLPRIRTPLRRKTNQHPSLVPFSVGMAEQGADKDV